MKRNKTRPGPLHPKPGFYGAAPAIALYNDLPFFYSYCWGAPADNLPEITAGLVGSVWGEQSCVHFTRKALANHCSSVNYRAAKVSAWETTFPLHKECRWKAFHSIEPVFKTKQFLESRDPETVFLGGKQNKCSFVTKTMRMLWKSQTSLD